jgi:hypothetical protein
MPLLGTPAQTVLARLTRTVLTRMLGSSAVARVQDADLRSGASKSLEAVRSTGFADCVGESDETRAKHRVPERSQSLLVAGNRVILEKPLTTDCVSVRRRPFPRDEVLVTVLNEVSWEGGLRAAADPVAIRLNPLPTDGWW